MSDYDTLTDSEKLQMHIERGEKPETREHWTPSYEAAITEPPRLLDLLDESTVYGGGEVQAALTERIQEQRGWVEGLSFSDWWLYCSPWGNTHSLIPDGPEKAKGKAWKTLRGEVRTACNPYLRKEQCIHRHVYRIKSRNLAFGAYNEQTGGFNGIRTKFGRKYIFEEYHWDNLSFATVQPQEDIGVLPEGIEPVESLGTETKEGRRIWFDREALDPEGDLVAQQYGRSRFEDTGEFVPKEVSRYVIHNDALFEHMKAIEQAAGVWVEDSEG